MPLWASSKAKSREERQRKQKPDGHTLVRRHSKDLRELKRDMLHSVLNPRFEDVEALMQIMLLLTALVISVVVASITSIEATDIREGDLWWLDAEDLLDQLSVDDDGFWAVHGNPFGYFQSHRYAIRAIAAIACFSACLFITTFMYVSLILSPARDDQAFLQRWWRIGSLPLLLSLVTFIGGCTLSTWSLSYALGLLYPGVRTSFYTLHAVQQASGTIIIFGGVLGCTLGIGAGIMAQFYAFGGLCSGAVEEPEVAAPDASSDVNAEAFTSVVADPDPAPELLPEPEQEHLTLLRRQTALLEQVALIDQAVRGPKEPRSPASPSRHAASARGDELLLRQTELLEQNQEILRSIQAALLEQNKQRFGEAWQDPIPSGVVRPPGQARGRRNHPVIDGDLASNMPDGERHPISRSMSLPESAR